MALQRWPKDNQTARNAFYGDPGCGEIGPQMVPVVPPFAMYYEGKRVKAIQFHRKAAPALLAALNEIWDACGHDQARIDTAGVSKYNGAYNHRLVRGSRTKWSNHAYAAAIDLNASENGLYAKGNMPQFVIDAFCRQGAMWGGWYTGRKDPMHFEFVDNGGRVPANPAPVFMEPVAFADIPDAPADEFEDDATPETDASDDTEQDASDDADATKGDKTVIAARATAAVAAATPVAGTVASNIVGQSSDIADQVTSVVDKSGQVVAVTKQVVSIPKPGFWNGLLHIVTSPGFLIAVIVTMALAWIFVLLWQHLHKAR